MGGDHTLVYKTALEGLVLLSALTIRVLEHSAYKYTHPIHPGPENATSYELAVRYNYGPEDRRVLVEFMAMIKNLSSLLYAVDGDLQVALDNFMFHTIQMFMRSNVTDYYQQAVKKKKPYAGMLKIVRDAMTAG